MDRSISRRDFVNGVAVAVGGAVVRPPWWWQEGVYAPEQDPAYYPPALTGLRGSHPGSFEMAHAMRDGSIGSVLSAARPTGEHYDLIVVGAGISGLAAAYYYRQAVGTSARVLLLDNHDDFGGHAKRNEFSVSSDAGTREPMSVGQRSASQSSITGDGARLLGYGGTQSIDGPDTYSRGARALIADLGVDLERFYTAYDRGFYLRRGMSQGVFFDRETFGRDHLAVGAGVAPWATVLTQAPLDSHVRQDVIRVYEGTTDYLAGRTKAQKIEHLARTSYQNYLLHDVKVAPEAIPVFQALTNDLWGLGIDAVPAYALYDSGFRAGFQGLGLDPATAGHLKATPPEGEEPYIFHFPDGNATVARLLVRRLIPAAVPGHTMDDIVGARVHYAALDGAGPVRLRLNSTAVRVRHVGPHEVEVTYVRGGTAWTARAGGVVLACWNMVIPYLCPEMSATQKAGLAYGAKVPLVYTNVAFTNWTAFDRLRVANIYAPGCYHTLVDLDYPVSLGNYHFSHGPEQPIVAHLLRTPCHPGLPAREQHRAGRAELLATSFETFERNIRDELSRILGPGGFDPARDIAGITVNRWPHGYAYEYNTLWDAAAWPGAEKPCVVGRQRFGRIAIANSDAGAHAYTNTAIDEAHRAVRELVGEARSG
jgi:spermidine dehydrogenase